MEQDTLSIADAQSIGVDISKTSLDAHAFPCGVVRSFPNTPNGSKAFLKWIAGFDVTRVVFEPTGAYHHGFERALGSAGVPACKINPLQARRYAQARGTRAKTDAVDAAMLARMGHEFALEAKVILCQAIDDMKELSVARMALVKDRTAAINRQHVRRSPLLVRQTKARITQIDKQIEEIDAAIAAIMATQTDLKSKEKILLSIPGIGPATVRALLIDMPELGQIGNPQAASLVGLAPVARDSGAMRGKRYIGGGRGEVRSALYMATITAIKKNPIVKTIYDRQRAQSKPFKVALVAAMHQLLKLAQALLKSRQKWNPHLANLTVA